MEQILIVDDDAALLGLLTDYLGGHGYRVTSAGEADAFWRAWQNGGADIVIFDVMLPGEDGFTLARKLRSISAVPIMMLSARSDETDRIVGLELGADDYLSKPFSARELAARIKALLRRAKLPDAGESARLSTQLYFGFWRFDPVGRHLVDERGVVESLSGAEFRLLSLFLERPGRILTRDQIMDSLYRREADPFDRSVDILVSRLRQKLRDDAKEPAIIKTVRGEGYVLASRVRKNCP